MAERYFVDSLIEEDPIVLSGSEAQHLVKVMRAAEGDVVTLFDGSGAEFSAQVVSIGRSQAELAITERTEVDRETRAPITLGVALPKGDRQRWLVEKVVELGVARLVPLKVDRGVAAAGSAALSRARKGVIGASKQCRRNRLMEIGEPQSLSDFVNEVSADACRLIAHPDGGVDLSVAIGAQVESAAPVFLAVGPEGGFTDKEIEIAQEASWTVVNLGQRILRVETACIALAANFSLR